MTAWISALLLVAGCGQPISVVVLDAADRSPLAGVQVVFHQGSSVMADLRTDELGETLLEANEAYDISIRAEGHAETTIGVVAGERIEAVLHLPEPMRMLEIVPPAQLPMQVDFRYSSACGGSGTRAPSGPFTIETGCTRETIAMVARDAAQAELAWSAISAEGVRAEMPAWSTEWEQVEVSLDNVPAAGMIDVEISSDLQGRRAYVLSAKVGASGGVRLAPIGTRLVSARVWSGDDVTTRIWKAPSGPIAIDFTSLLPMVEATIAGGSVDWSIDSPRIDGGVITAVYPDDQLYFWNVVVPPDATHVDFPPLPWTSIAPYEIDVEMLDADFAADYGQRRRELGPSFYPRSPRESWRVDISTARRRP